MFSISKRKREGSRAKIKSMGDHKEFLQRISKSLYYGQLPSLPCLSLPLTEISCEEWSSAQCGRSLRRLRGDTAAGIARRACVSPAALVLALLYLERLRRASPEYLAAMAPNELFLVSLMVGNKFLQDDGADEEVFCSEWAASGGLELAHLKRLELQFLSAMDWNIFVSEHLFEQALRHVERRVALKQAALRGFFTYADLRAGADGLKTDAARVIAVAIALSTLAYVTGLLALLASTFALTHCHALLRASMTSQPLAPQAPNASLTLHTLDDVNPLHTLGDINSDELLDEDLQSIYGSIESQAEPIRCCTQWLRHHETKPRKWQDSVVVYDWKDFEPWWSRTSLLNWLYQSSLVGPVQRWLERVDVEVRKEDMNQQECEEYDQWKPGQKCVSQWLNLSKLLGALVASLADR